MNNFNKIPMFLAVSMIVLFLASCDLDDDENTVPIPDSTIVDLALETEELSSLVSALQRADLVGALEADGPFTVLAPNNSAFNNFLSQNGFTNLEAVPVPVLRELLLNHVVSGRLDAAPLTNLGSNYLETLAGGPTENSNLALYFNVDNAITFNGTSTVLQPDIVAANGIIHIVDGVIDLPSIETFINTDGNFEELGIALDLIGPVSTIPSALETSDAGPFTVFAPLNSAFDALLETNPDWNFVSDIEEDLLANVIAHHALNGNIRSENISNDQNAPTLQGEDIVFSVSNGQITITDGAGNAGINVDGLFNNIQATNGIIHVVNQVLLPDTTN